MPQTTSKPRAVGVILAVILGATACTGLGGGGTTTVVTSVVNNSGGGASPSTSASSSKQINDKATLCNLFSSRGAEIIHAIRDLSGTVQNKDWQWSEPDVSAAGDKVVSTIDKAVPILQESIGPQIPQNVSDAMKEFLGAASDYSSAVSARVDSDKMNSAYDTLYKAEGDFDAACGYKK